MIRPNHYKHRDTAMCLRFSRDEKNLIEELAASEDCSRTDLIIFCVRSRTDLIIFCVRQYAAQMRNEPNRADCLCGQKGASAGIAARPAP